MSGMGRSEWVRSRTHTHSGSSSISGEWAPRGEGRKEGRKRASEQRALHISGEWLSHIVGLDTADAYPHGRLGSTFHLRISECTSRALPRYMNNAAARVTWLHSDLWAASRCTPARGRTLFISVRECEIMASAARYRLILPPCQLIFIISPPRRSSSHPHTFIPTSYYWLFNQFSFIIYPLIYLSACVDVMHYLAFFCNRCRAGSAHISHRPR